MSRGKGVKKKTGATKSAPKKKPPKKTEPKKPPKKKTVPNSKDCVPRIYKEGSTTIADLTHCEAEK